MKKIDKLNIMNILNFCASKGTIKKMKSTYRMGGNIYKSYVDKNLVSRICKELLHLKKKWAKDLK